jgi:hypothetical protein
MRVGMTLLRSCRSSGGAMQTAEIGTVGVDAIRGQPFLWNSHADRVREHSLHPSRRSAPPSRERREGLSDYGHVSRQAAHYVRLARGFGAHTTMTATRRA